MLRIKNWNETFENSDTRKRMRLGWFLCPADVNSSGYVELMSLGERGLRAYGVFIAICQWSATCLPPVRGLCARSDGRPISLKHLAALLRIDEKHLTDAVNILKRDGIGWLIEENEPNIAICQSSASHLPVVCQSSAGRLPQGEGEGEGEGEGCSLTGPAGSEPAVLTFQCRGEEKSWNLTSSQVSKWSEAYPGLDVLGECRKALAWVQSNTNNQKTADGMPRFLVNWMNRAVNQGHGRNAPQCNSKLANAPKYKNLLETGVAAK